MADEAQPSPREEALSVVPDWDKLTREQPAPTEERLRTSGEGDVFALEDRNCFSAPWRRILATRRGDKLYIVDKLGRLINEPRDGVIDGWVDVTELLDEFSESSQAFYRPPCLRRTPRPRAMADTDVALIIAGAPATSVDTTAEAHSAAAPTAADASDPEPSINEASIIEAGSVEETTILQASTTAAGNTEAITTESTTKEASTSEASNTKATTAEASGAPEASITDANTADTITAPAVTATARRTGQATTTEASTAEANLTEAATAEATTTATQTFMVGERVVIDGRLGGLVVEKGSLMDTLLVSDDGSWLSMSLAEAQGRLSKEMDTSSNLVALTIVRESSRSASAAGVLFGDRSGAFALETAFDGQARAFWSYIARPLERSARLRQRSVTSSTGFAANFSIGDFVRQLGDEGHVAAAPTDAIVARVVYKERVGSAQARKLLVLLESLGPAEGGHAPEHDPEFFTASWHRWSTILDPNDSSGRHVMQISNDALELISKVSSIT
ncbi:MAG: hypothetical protein SGPRY_009504 [Prymnesium sp.]